MAEILRILRELRHLTHIPSGGEFAEMAGMMLMFSFEFSRGYRERWHCHAVPLGSE